MQPGIMDSMIETHNTTSLPGVLVVIATLGQRPEYLKQTLESIVEQNYSNIDIVLVYPFKSKETKKLAKCYNAASLEDPGSMSSAVNLGISFAKNKYKYVTWIGDDDLLEPGMVKNSIAGLEKYPKSTASFGYCHYIDISGKRLFTSKAGRFAPWIMTWGPNLVPLPGSMFRLTSLHILDYIFDERLKYTMDLDLFLRLRKIGPLLNIGTPVSCFRWHATSATVSNRQSSLREAEEVKRRYLGRISGRLAFLWETPVRVATKVAASRINSKIAKL